MLFHPRSSLYSALPLTDSIRLLTLDPGDGSTIKGNLRVTSLSSRPCYSALSYTWHSPLGEKLGEAEGRGSEFRTRAVVPTKVAEHPTRSIEVNGYDVHVYENLYHALQRLRGTSVGQSYWIDQICVDQDNVDERSQQVEIMAPIFENAERVIIWLGPEHPTLAKAVALIADLSGLTAEERSRITPDTLETPEVTSLLPGGSHSREHWHALALFFCRRWFSRAWVIQEFILAERLLVLCGRSELLWSSLEIVSDFLALSAWTNAWGPRGYLVQQGLRPHHNSPTKLRAAKKELTSPSANILLYSLIRSRRYDCDDARDKVFSLYGIARRRLSPNRPVPPPNYQLSAPQVYLETAVNILRGSDDLLLLAYAEGECFRSSNVTGLPSWVPDWSVKAVVGLGVTGYKRFEAAPQRCRVLDIDPSQRVLTIDAARLDIITDAGASKRSVRDNKDITQWLAMAQNIPERYHTGETRMEAFWRTLITHNLTNAAKDNAFRSSFRNWLLDMFAHSSQTVEQANERVLRTLAQLEGNDRAERIPSEKESNFSTSGDSALFDVTFSYAMYLRLFTTAEHFLGLGTESLKVGDSIWIVSGSRVPLILRPSLSARSDPAALPRFELVGATYVHGVMNGQALGRPLEFRHIELA